MPKTIKTNSGIYILEIFVPGKFTLRIKKYEEAVFDKGYYYYVGSAQKALFARIKRHLYKSKIIHWHIDHITSLPFSQVTNVIIFPDKKKEFECILTSNLLQTYNFNTVAAGFGNSDCKSCKSHLLYSLSPVCFASVIHPFAGKYLKTIP